MHIPAPRASQTRRSPARPPPRRRGTEPSLRRRSAARHPVQQRAGARRAGARSRRAGSEARAMEQRLAEFRAARKRAGPAAEPNTWSPSAQTSGEKAEAAATPKAAPGWLKRFLVWKPRPARTQAQPSLAQVRGRPRPRDPASGTLSWPPRRLRPRRRPRPARRVVACRPRPRQGAGPAPSSGSHLRWRSWPAGTSRLLRVWAGRLRPLASALIRGFDIFFPARDPRSSRF